VPPFEMHLAGIRRAALLGLAMAASLAASAPSGKYVADYSVRYTGSDEFYVDARFQKPSAELSLFFFPSDKNPEGQAAFIKSLRAWDSTGHAQQLKYVGEAKWRASNVPVSRIQYTVLAHHESGELGTRKG